jgi:molybdenum cofactor cytidylyltransferase
MLGDEPVITAIILAAGESKRMGQPKMLLPWDRNTVLQTVIATFQTAGVDEVLVITGAVRHQVEALVGRSAQTVFNPHYAAGEMLSSIQVGLAEKMRESSAALIGLGDQPQVQARTVQRLLQSFRETGSSLIVPSYQNHRGHPWLVGRQYWEEILSMRSPDTMRDFFKRHADHIRYVAIEDPSILADLDTPEDYLKYQS